MSGLKLVADLTKKKVWCSEFMNYERKHCGFFFSERAQGVIHHLHTLRKGEQITQCLHSKKCVLFSHWYRSNSGLLWCTNSTLSIQIMAAQYQYNLQYNVFSFCYSDMTCNIGLYWQSKRLLVQMYCIQCKVPTLVYIYNIFDMKRVRVWFKQFWLCILWFSLLLWEYICDLLWNAWIPLLTYS